MSATRAFYLVIGLIILALVEGLIRHFCPGFPITEVLGFQAGAVAYILGTKTINDVKTMKYEAIKAGCADGK